MDLAVFTQGNQGGDLELGRKHEQLRRTILKLQLVLWGFQWAQLLA